MRQVDPTRISEINAFLTAPAVPMPESADGTVIFGRKSSHLVETAAEAASRSDFVVISGEVGKDSGNNPMYGVREDEWLTVHLETQGISGRRIHTDPHHPKNGIDNANGMLAVMQDELGLTQVDTLIGVSHATQALRLGATLLQRINESNLKVENLAVVASAYPFNPKNPYDQKEAAFEITRLDELSQGPDAVFPRPEGLDPFVEYAWEVSALLDQRFAESGIVNWSTADDTYRNIPPDDLPGVFERARQRHQDG